MKAFKNKEIIIIITNDGKTTPSVAKKEPKNWKAYYNSMDDGNE